MKKKTCRQCLWFDQCGQETACEYYDPADKNETEQAAEDDYKDDLQMRHEDYKDKIKEERR